MSFQRPAFWRIPHNRPDPEARRRKVNPGTPAQKELVRGDIITKIDEYDSRDLRHEDAQNLFRNAGQTIKLAIQRDVSTNKIPPAMSNGSSRCSSSMLQSPLPPPYIPVATTPTNQYCGSPVPSGQSPIFKKAMAAPVATLPHTVFPPELPGMGYNSVPTTYRPTSTTPVASLPHTVFPPELPGTGFNSAPSPYRPTSTTPLPTMGSKSPGLFSPVFYREEFAEEAESLVNQPYRTTPLVLPGAKVKKEAGPTESYLRHHPNPAMRAAPHHDHDVLMKQKVADTMLHRVAGEDGAIKYAHKQFNSPIGLYSENNIADTIKRDTNTVPTNGYLGRPTKSKSYKKTVLYDPAKSETYRALQEDSYGDVVQEVPVPAQTKVFHAPASKTGPIKKPAPQPQQQTQSKNTSYVSALNDETIQQSNSFKRLMYHVLGETTY